MDNKDVTSEINKRVEEELEKRALNEKIETLLESSSIFPDIIRSLGGLRKSVEALNTNITEIKDNQSNHKVQSERTLKDLNNVYDKVRDIEEKIVNLERSLIDKNNSSSLIEVIKKIHKEQDAGMVDQNNPKSIISILKKNSNVQATITWALVTTMTVLSIISKIFWVK